jgi:hypothetical protein
MVALRTATRRGNQEVLTEWVGALRFHVGGCSLRPRPPCAASFCWVVGHGFAEKKGREIRAIQDEHGPLKIDFGFDSFFVLCDMPLVMLSSPPEKGDKIEERKNFSCCDRVGYPFCPAKQ